MDRKKMSIENRAKQFMPFDALKGYKEALRETDHYYEPKVELTDSAIEQINNTIKNIMPGDRIEVIYYDTDVYKTIKGKVFKVDEKKQILEIALQCIEFSKIKEIQFV